MKARPSCSIPGCPKLATKQSRCADHAVDWNRTTSGRGYGHDHRQLRNRWAMRVESGGIRCAKCGEPIQPGTPWDLGHTDDRSGYTGPEHASCNRSHGARLGNGTLDRPS